MGRKAGRKPKYRAEHTGPVSDFGPREIWSKDLVVRSYGAEAQRHEVISCYVLRNRSVTEGGIVTAAGTFNQAQNALDKLALRGVLGTDEALRQRRDAGEMLMELFENAGLEGKTTASLSGMGGGGGPREQSDWSAIDEMRYHDALDAIRPYDALVKSVCCYDILPADRKAVLAALTKGLDLLHRHFSKPNATSCRHERRVG